MLTTNSILSRAPVKAALFLLLFSWIMLARPGYGAGTPPVITVQPTNVAVLNLGMATFQVTASSGTTMTYQWRKNGANITGAILSSYTIPVVTSTDVGNYSVKIVNAAGSVVSANAALTIATTPSITTQPASLTATQGFSRTLSVVASGTSPLAYQWSLNGTPLLDATNAALLLTNIQTADAGPYRVTVTNPWGAVTSSTATLTVLVPAGITTQPLSTGVVKGQTATFTVTASGTAPYTYQWKFKGSSISGATNAALSLSNVQTNQAGDYTVVVMNSSGSKTSSVATLTVYLTPGISTQPSSLTATQGLSRTLSVIANGSAPLAYQWNLDGAPLPNKTNASLTLANVQTSDAGSYTVVVSNPWGSITSSVATLTVLVPPTITTQPQSQQIVLGQNAAFSMEVTGTSPFQCQWRFNGSPITGATDPALQLSNVLSNQSGNYSVVVSNGAGWATSAVATLTVFVPAGIATQPQSRTSTQGLSTALSVLANGTAPFSYQWSFNDTPLADATNALLLIGNVQTSAAGSYTVAVANDWGSVTSAVATLTVLVPPSFTTQPVSQSIVRGDSVTFTSAADGTAPLSYQWRFNGAPLAGQTDPLLQLNYAQSNASGSYSVVAMNAAGSITSSVAFLTVYVPAEIVTQPVSLTATQGLSRSLSVVAGGTAPFAYQWSFNDTPLLDETNASLQLPNVQTSHAGDYVVAVANDWGSVTSTVATLTVLVPPGIVTQPQSLAIVSGQSATFTVEGSGTDPLSYQWRFNGSPLAVGDTLALSNVQSNQAGNYSAIVINAAGSVTSSVAVLTVYVPALIATQPVSLVKTQGQTATFTTTAGGTGPLKYQWNFNGTPLPNATNASLTRANVQSTDAGNYTVCVTNSWGSETSVVATLTVLVPPAIAAAPQDLAIVKGQNATFLVSATGTAPLTYQWRLNGSPLASATNAVLSMSNVQSNQAGIYSVVVNNSAGSVTSAGATLTVYVPAGIATQPVSLIKTQGQSATFSTIATGTAPFGYQWNLNGSALTGATNASLALANLQPPDAGNYTVLVTNAWGSVTSAVATLTVLVPAGISTQPQDLAIVQGQGATFSVTATGTAPWTYQWRFNGTPLANATNAVLAQSNVQSNQAGIYSVIVNNSAGSVTSTGATLTVYVPAGIGTQPVSLTRTQGNTATFSTVATGTAPFGYQWNFNGSPMANATNTSLVLANIQPPNAGNYTVLVTNSWGAVTSSVATLTVLVPSGISTQPQDLAIVKGQSATFSVTASGTAPLTYQWRFNGSPLPAETNSILALSNVQSNQAGIYTVVVNNSAGTVTSTGATLTVYVPAGITTQPISLVRTQGNTVTFSTAASGTAPFGYQWNFNGSALANATNASLVLANIQPPDAGNYTVLVTNAWGSATSAVATLTVLVPPGLSTQPQDLAIVKGQSPTFSVTASGTAPFIYQWRLNGSPLASATNAVLALSNVQSNQAGIYTVVVNNSAGTVTSTGATLTVYVPAGIATQPVSLTRTQGNTATFSTVASGTAPFGYQWSFNGSALANATNASLTLNNLQPPDAGNYSVLVTNGWGAVTSSVATLTVLVPPGIATQPQDLAIVKGQSATFSVTAGGTAPLTYQWRLNGSPLSAATNAVLAMNNVQSNQAGIYTVVVNNSAGTVTSTGATLTVYVPAGIATQPVSLTRTQGNTATFSTVASGTAPFGYQWNLNGSALPNATNASLVLNNLHPPDAGNYTVLVTNAWGSATSTVATLTVLVPAGISTQPQDQTVVKDQSATFSVVATGTAPFTYQWRFNGLPVAAATNAVFAMSNVQSNQAGIYTVIVNNAAGTLTSTGATLTVYVPAGIATQPISLIKTQGQSATFSTAPSGTAPFGYQWNFNGTAMTGATNSAVLLNNVQPTDEGNYTVLVSNAWGSAMSAIASLTVLVPPGVFSQPQNLAVVKGQTATFGVTPTGTAPFTYQWRFNGSALSTETNALLSLSNVQSNQAGSYNVVVNNSAGSITSAVATLTVYVPAGIATQPASQTTTQGMVAAFSTVANGTAPFAYQWRLGGVAVPAATNASLLIANSQTSDAGNYTVVVTNAWGAITSSVATLTVLIPATITNQPQNQGVVQFQTATFTVGAIGTGTMNYQWRLNGSPISSSTSPLLTLTNVQTSQAGNYSVVVSNLAGSVTSTVATLTVYVPAGISTQPQSQSVTQGQTATFSVVGSGTAPFAYQWKYLNVDVAGATNATLVLTNVKFIQAGDYVVAVSNPWGTATSATASMMVVPRAGSDMPLMQGLVAHLTFDEDLRDSSGRANHAAPVGSPMLVPGFIGEGAFNPYTEGTTNNYATLGTSSDFLFGKTTDFSVSFWAQFPAGSWNGSAAHKDPVFLSNKDWSSPDNVGWVVATGDDGRLQWNYTENSSQTRKDYDGPGGVFGNSTWHHVAITFRRTFSAVTYLDGVPVSTNSIGGGGKLIDSGLPTNIGNDGTGGYPSAYGYWTNALANPDNGLHMDDVGIWNRLLTAQEICAMYNLGLSGEDLESVASTDLTVTARPRIAQSPVSLVVNAGSNATFSATATGSTLAYQWYADGVAVSGGTSATLTLSNVQPTQAASYYVRITNSSGTATSAVATLTVNSAPLITAQPQSQSLGLGQTASLTVTASGTGPLSYQWSRNGTNLAGATSPVLSLTNLQAAHAGTYTVRVTNFVGAITSAAATLTVTNPVISLSFNSSGMSPSGFTFHAGVPMGLTFVTLASTNLVDWTPIATNVATSASTAITDPQAALHQKRFYKVMLP